ncbi:MULTISPECIES: sulfite exporter TauE/SafE family protein [Pectobacterium]|nr:MULTISPECIES: sulfite exporter TauE/SafE family protein [Pectobacterium]MCL6358512.1 sulfite exporter TauE/SafE family protein [Pectobacterium polaris]MCY9848788.1 sulfite exporter TauE/SafE family protein [Pectobacterium jejuense]UMO86441.1 sulfite exporter TauE/SafE family protein [Pectobacterium sp. PL64]
MFSLMMLSDMLLCLFLGVGLGVCGGMLGIGGGLIAIPVLGILFGMDQHLAQGTALVMITPNVLIGFLRYRQRNRIDTRIALTMCVFASVSAYFAAHIASSIDVHHLQNAFAIFLLVLAAYYMFQWYNKQRNHSSDIVLSTKYLPLLGVASGFMSGIFTVGGGLVVVPVLVTLFAFAQTQAQGMALILVVPGALAALLSYSQAGNVDWSIGLPLALGGIFSVSWGVALAHKMPVAYLRGAFCLVLVGVGITMLAVK